LAGDQYSKIPLRWRSSLLLDLAGVYLPPFYVNTEEEVHLVAEDEGLPIRGRIDVLVLGSVLGVGD